MPRSTDILLRLFSFKAPVKLPLDVNMWMKEAFKKKLLRPAVTVAVIS